MTNRTTTYHYMTRSFLPSFLAFLASDSVKVALINEMVTNSTGSTKPNAKTKIKYFLMGSFLDATHKTDKLGKCSGIPNTRQFRDPNTGKFAKHPNVKVA